jgi:signal transduction histidine kinase
MDLASLLLERRDPILRRWTAKVTGSLHPLSMPRLELVDHLPTFLEEIADHIRQRQSPEKSPTAAEHGLQRLALGFNLDSVVREYGELRHAIVEEAAAEGTEIAPPELETLFNCVITGIAEAVSEYTRQRDAEMQRQTSEHFAFIAHELRNPLGTALTALNILRSGNKIADDRLGNILERALTRTNGLIERSLRLAQVGATVTLVREKVMLGTLLHDAESAASAEAEAKGVQLSIDLKSDVELDVDVRLVHSALTNVLRNAVKFTHDGSRVQVRARAEDRRVTIEVEDCCGGLPPGKIEQAFAPFVQVGTDRSGFGLGLAIAKQAADAHGGLIRVQNLPEKGCIFVLELPIASPA